MNRLLLGLMLLLTATAVRAEWSPASDNDQFIQYVDTATIRRNGNLVKMWDLVDFKTVQTVSGVFYFSDKSQREYDCKEERSRTLAFAWFDGKMGYGKVVYSDNDISMKWAPIQPESTGEALWKIACGK